MTLMGLFGASAVIRPPNADLASGKLCPPCPPFVTNLPHTRLYLHRFILFKTRVGCKYLAKSSNFTFLGKLNACNEKFPILRLSGTYEVEG